MELRSGRTTSSAAPGSSASHQGALGGAAAGPSAAPPPSASGLAHSSSDTGAPQATCGLLDLLPQDLLRKLLVERCCCFTPSDEQDSRTALALMGTCRALGRLVMAAAPRRTLTMKLSQQQQQWPSGLSSLLSTLAPPDLKLVIRSAIRSLLTPITVYLHTSPPQPFWPFITSLRLAYVDMTQQVLAALQLHQWPRLQELEVHGRRFVPSNPPSSHPLQPLPHLHTLRLKGDLPEEQLHIWMPLAQGPSLRVLGLHSGEHASLLLQAAGHVTQVEVQRPRPADVRLLALFPQLQHVTIGSTHTLGSEDLSTLQCPWTSMCLEHCDLQGLLWLPLGPSLQTLTIRGVWGLLDPTTISAALDKLRQHQGTLRVVVEGFGAGTWQHGQWRLGRHERVATIGLFNAELLRWVGAACPEATVPYALTPTSSWEEALPALQELGRVHTVCLSAHKCKPELAAALPACIHHVKVQGNRLDLYGLAPFVGALPAHVQRLSLLCIDPAPPDLARVEAARAARLAPLVLSVAVGI